MCTTLLIKRTDTLIILYKDVDTLERQDPAELLLAETGRDELSCANLTINILISNEQIQ
jgi:hypothetical protein